MAKSTSSPVVCLLGLKRTLEVACFMDIPIASSTWWNGFATSRIAGRSAGDGDSQVIELSDQHRPIDAAEPKIGSVWNTRNAATADTCIPGLAQQIAPTTLFFHREL
jgi:hypothetical protein